MRRRIGLRWVRKADERRLPEVSSPTYEPALGFGFEAPRCGESGHVFVFDGLRLRTCEKNWRAIRRRRNRHGEWRKSVTLGVSRKRKRKSGERLRGGGIDGGRGLKRNERRGITIPCLHTEQRSWANARCCRSRRVDQFPERCPFENRERD